MNAAERERLWADFLKKPTAELRERIIVEYAPLVRIVAGRLSMYLGYNVEYDDLVGYGPVHWQFLHPMQSFRFVSLSF